MIPNILENDYLKCVFDKNVYIVSTTFVTYKEYYFTNMTFYLKGT